MDKQKLLQELGKTPYGKALKEYLEEELRSIGDVDNAKNEAELVGAQIAKKTVRKLFSFLEEKKPAKPRRRNYA